MRTPIVVGNWKLNKTLADAESWVNDVKNAVGPIKGVDVGFAPIALHLQACVKRTGENRMFVAAQNTHFENSGAWTGEWGPDSLVDIGCRWVIIGHSERRQFFGDTNAAVAKKIKAAQAAGLTAIACLGETDAERSADKTEEVVSEQLDAILDGAMTSNANNLVLAYEPVWAIGTGKTATPETAQEVHAFIRSRVATRWTAEAAAALRIQYGGSVKPGNAAELMAQPDIDGALVGGASLSPRDFLDIVRAAAK